MIEEKMPIKITGDDPYEEVAKIVERWCEKHYYNSALVTLSIDGVETTEYLEFDGSEMTFIWENDWWEGEKEVQLLGFRMLQDLKLYGFPNDADLEHRRPCDHNIAGEMLLNLFHNG